MKAVGGTTTDWAGALLRFQDHEWMARTTDADVACANLRDWPIDPREMDGLYTRAEEKMRVTRTGSRPGLPGNNSDKVSEAGAKGIGKIEVSTGHMAINSDETGDRKMCRQTGFCFQGCKWGAKWSTAYTEVPEGEATGNMEVRERCHVARILHDAIGKVTGVDYVDADGNL